MFKWLKRLVCKHENVEEKYCEIEGWCELHYWRICRDCGKEWVK